MRHTLLAAVCGLSSLAAVSLAAAANDAAIKKQPSDTTSSAPDTSSGPPLMTREQENKIPYRACPFAAGWVNGHLICRNSP
jgi:hypothetical protein